MDYNRVQSYIKSHVLPKLDSLQTGMDGIPNLLTPSFDSIKNVLSTIATKVDNVRGGGGDLNHTALTDLQQRLTAVEGSVGKVEQDVGGLGVPLNLKVATATSSGTVLDIKGKGKLYACGIGSYPGTASSTLSITIDGTNKNVSSIKGGVPLGAYVSVPVLLDFSGDRRGSGNQDAIYVRTICGRLFGTRLDAFGIRFVEEDSIPNDFDGKFYITRQPLTFSSLKAVVGGFNDSCTGIVAYTLDE